MPGFTTHYIFGITTYKRLADNDIKKIITKNISAYKLGLQGPDIFFYYLPGLFINPENSLGKIMHETKTNLFFENYLTEISNYQDKKLEVAYAYLSGFLCHYCLDTICHPYIYARTNYNLLIERSKDNNRNIYHADHRSFETLIDSIILERYANKKPSEFKKENTINLDNTTKEIITSLLSNCINRTYSNLPKKNLFISCFNTGKETQIKPSFIPKVLRFVQLESKFLAKLSTNKKMIEQIENRLLKCNLLSSLIPSDDFKDTSDALNISHNMWCSPWEVSITRNDSFLNLTKKAFKKCTILLNMFDSSILDIKNCQIKFSNKCTDITQILNELGNLSYHSGLVVSP